MIYTKTKYLVEADNSTKRVLVLSADAGFGHRSAAKAIVTALKETHGDKCLVEMVNPLNDKRVPNLLRESQTDYDKLVTEMPRLYELGYEFTDATVISAVLEGALIVMLFEVIHSLIQRFQPDAIITTYPLYQAPLSAVYLVYNHYIPLLSVVTDLSTVHGLWFHKAADQCLTPTRTVRDLAVKYGLEPSKLQITGIPVDPDLAKNEDRTLLRAKLGWQSKQPVVLAVGSKRVEHLEDTLRIINHSGLQMQLVAVAGGNDVLFHHLQSVEWHMETQVHNFVTNLPEMMHGADCIICKAGGLIVSESLACGLPLILIDVLPGQETGNAAYVVENGAGELAGDPLLVLEILYHWLADDQRLLVEKASCAQHLGRPRSAFEIANIVWQYAQKDPLRRKDRNQNRHRKLTKLLDRHRIHWRR